MKKRLFSSLCVLGILLSFCGGALAVEEADTRLEAIRVLGIMVGDENGDMALSRPVKRAEFAKMMTTASLYKDSVGGGYGVSLFRDVKTGHWANEYIKLGVEQGWFTGYVDGTFRPDNTITLEEACTALLRLLDYDPSTLAGSFPTAQLSKAGAIGLLANVNAGRGQQLTRQDCVELFYNLLIVQNSAGRVYGTTLGHTVTNGEVDYASLVAADLKGPYVYSGGGIKLPFSGEVTVYRDGAPSDLSQVEQFDVYYYNANLHTVWVYTDRVIGTISAVSPSRISPSAVTVAGKSYPLGSSTAAYQLSAQGGFGDNEPVTLLLDMNGAVAEVLHGVHGELDEDSYTTVVNTDTQGPFVAANGILQLPFSVSDAEIYLNGSLVEATSVKQHDVYYYNPTLRTVWVYRNKVVGTMTAVAPSLVSPTSVTVAGKSYSIGTSTAAYLLSSQGSFSVGDTVTLLLGMNGDVVDVLNAKESEGIYYGVVTSSEKVASSAGTDTAIVRVESNITCTDGTVRTFLHSGSTLSVGRLVKITVDSTGTAVERLNEKNITATVNSSATKLGNYALADGVEIIDTDDNGNCVSIYPSRLAGVKLDDNDVLYYTLDESGAIDRLILDKVTGDAMDYVYITSAQNNHSNMNISSSYTYLKDGQSRTMNFSSIAYSVTQGGAVLLYDNGSLKSMRQLTSVKLTSLSELSAMAENQKYLLAENVQVVLRSGGSSYPTTLSEINAQDYNLQGWYDDLGYSAGKRIRVLVATPKG